MYAVISPQEIQLPAGSVVRLLGTWQEYQILCDRRGDGSIPRIKYHSGEILLMSPLPKHGREAHLLAAIITTLLDHQEQEYDAFTPVTMQLPEASGIEPDYCFYIDHWQAVSGKERIDWLNDPPPDLVLEIDVTSYSDAQDYLPYRVPEVWLFRQEKLLIYQLQGDEYSIQTQSQYFPEVNLADVVAECLTLAYQRNTSAAIRHLKQQLVDTDQKNS
ncbi:Uma2 family endonuclease [Roseofilum sp. BLCC_M154]|uniref:Uma2 family endonuclease n=1 Tax=Roseofilum acuticapitatum BLCC-M154 TaxID=3022444 RepID=A0ABT7AUH1_9CYAN|nr:Uma2 family endonuclease [Roseofilum acuticapitatum]MDJ1170544.1 Uma2 family endonuclease [Roseofilum acuticapitatum BLCC-M154]